MIFGRPGEGKSTLAIMLANYLAENHGKVLYVGREEGVTGTMQEKLQRLNAAHKHLYVTDSMPTDMSGFRFIFLDSINSIGIDPKELETLYKRYPSKSFVSVFKGTKNGDFRGSLDFEHDVDVSIKCEKGKAYVNKNRFGGNGKMKIW